jgi:hypothetical protein
LKDLLVVMSTVRTIIPRREFHKVISSIECDIKGEEKEMNEDAYGRRQSGFARRRTAREGIIEKFKNAITAFLSG